MKRAVPASALGRLSLLEGEDIQVIKNLEVSLKKKLQNFTKYKELALT